MNQSNKKFSFDDPQNGVIFHVENRSRMKGSPQKFVEENSNSIRKTSFGLLTTSTGFLAGWVPIFLSHPWCCSQTLVASYFHDSQITLARAKSSVPSSGLPSLSFFEERLSGLPFEGTTFSSYNHSSSSAASLFQVILGGYCLHWRQSLRCLLTGCHWLCFWPSTSRQLFYSSLVEPRYLLEKNIWENSEIRLAACSRSLFHAVSQSSGLVKLPCALALQPTGMR